MGDALITAPLVAAVVLIASGIAKLRDPGSVGRAFTALKVPRALDRGWIRSAYPWGEIALGVLLLVTSGPLAVLVALATLALFATYLVLIWRAYRSPADVNCNCFGALNSGRVTGLTVARNVTLIAFGLAAVVDAVAGRSVVARLLDAGTLGWVLAVAATAWLVFAVVREGAEEPAASPAQAAGPVPVDTTTTEEELGDYVRIPTPLAVLLDAEGGPVTLTELTRQRAALLVWVSFGCGSCGPVIEQLPAWRNDMPQVDIRMILTTLDQLQQVPEGSLDSVLIDPQWSLGRTVGTQGTPSAVLFGADGMLAGGPVSGADDVISLANEMKEALAAAPEPVAPPQPIIEGTVL